MSCSCHINPPCSYCMELEECIDCGKLVHPYDNGVTDTPEGLVCASCYKIIDSAQIRRSYTSNGYIFIYGETEHKTYISKDDTHIGVMEDEPTTYKSAEHYRDACDTWLKKFMTGLKYCYDYGIIKGGQ